MRAISLRTFCAHLAFLLLALCLVLFSVFFTIARSAGHGFLVTAERTGLVLALLSLLLIMAIFSFCLYAHCRRKRYDR